MAGVSGPGAFEKVKFTVSVRGHQWSSARQVQETLQEFARVIQRNARRLDFIGDGDSIQRLQLANADGTEPEELDVDATLEDVIICMGRNKQLVAIVNSSSKSTPPPPPLTECNGRPDTEKLGPASPMGLASLHKPKAKNDTPPSSSLYGSFATPGSACLVPEDNNTELPGVGVKPLQVLLKNHGSVNYKPRCDPAALRALKIMLPSSDPSPATFQEEGSCAFTQEYEPCEAQVDCRQQLPAMASRSNNFDVNGGGVGACAKGMQVAGAMFNSGLTPSPAELAQFLVRGSTLPQQVSSSRFRSMSNGIPIKPLSNQSTPNAGFQSFGSELLSQLPVMPNSHMQCSTGTPNIAMLAQFLASQLRAFAPVPGGAHPSADSAPISPTHSKVVAPTKEALGPTVMKLTPQTAGHDATQCPETSLPEFRSPKLAAVAARVSVSESHEKDQSSSSANANATAAPSSDGIDSEQVNGQSDLIFLVNRRSKTGLGTHHLKMSDLSAYFHLSVVDAAKKLGVSQTTLKKACRKFGLKRWPGRKVRSLESTIHGLEHTIAVGQGAGMEELTEAYMRSEVTKLQQEMDQLVHGTPAQHSPVVRTADLYKRLYSRGWRSKYHSPCSRFDLDLNNASNNNEISILSHSTRKPTEATKLMNSGCKAQDGALLSNEQEPIANNQKPDVNPKKDLQDLPTIAAVKDTISNESNEPFPRESTKGAKNVEESAKTVLVENGATTGLISTTKIHHIPCLDRDQQPVDKDKPLPTERSPKRRKRECSRTASEAQGRPGLRSGACA